MSLMACRPANLARLGFLTVHEQSFVVATRVYTSPRGGVQPRLGALRLRKRQSLLGICHLPSLGRYTPPT